MEGLKKNVDIGGEKVEIDLAQPFTKASLGADPGKFLPTAMEGLRQIAVDALAGAHKTEGERNEIVAKLTKDVETALDEHKKLVELVRENKRETPDKGFDSDKLKLSGVRLSRRVGQLGEGERQSFGSISQPFYNLLAFSSDELDIADKNTRREHLRLQFLHDSIVLRIAYLSKRNPAFLAGQGWQSLPGADEYIALVKKFGAAVNEMRLAGVAMNETNATEGAQWVPSLILSSRILPYYELDYTVQGAFETVQMPGPTYRIPVLGNRVQSVLLMENLDGDGATGGAVINVTDGGLQSWTTNKVDFTAKMHGVGIVDTPSWEEDWIGTTDWILRELALGIARGREEWFINGQKTAQIDSAETIATYNARKIGDGLRYWYKQGKDAGIVSDIDASAGLTAELLAKAIGQGGAYAFPANRNVFITSAAGAAQMLVLKTQNGQSVVLTDNEMGAQSTFRVGSLGKAFGRDVLVSPRVSEQMTAGGLVDTVTPGDRTIVLHCNVDAFKRGERRGILVDFSTDARFFQNQNAYKATAREDFENCYAAATYPAIQQIVGVKKF